VVTDAIAERIGAHDALTGQAYQGLRMHTEECGTFLGVHVTFWRATGCMGPVGMGHRGLKPNIARIRCAFPVRGCEFEVGIHVLHTSIAWTWEVSEDTDCGEPL
jgi:hypothetical protein